ncbi:MAG: MATE family efflux transporter [Oscillospiraceae bacterium]|nr:MATE family efflux transporter [Oscillospiraceae bacterium]
MNQKKYGLDLTEGRVSTLLLRFAWPFLVSGIISALYGIVDLFVIGQYNAKDVISGVSTGTQVINLVYTATIGIGTGGTVLIGRKIGERDREGCARSAGTFLLIGAMLAVFLTAFVLAVRAPLLTLLQTPDGARPSASRYVIYAALGLPFVVGFNVIGAIARGLGNSRTPSVIGAIGCFLNIGLDFLLVGKFGMAEVGVAVATSISQGATFILIGAWLLKNKFPFPFTRRDLRLDAGAFRNVFRVGLPLWAQELLVHVSFMIITGVVNAMGANESERVVAGASVGVISKVFTFGGLFPMSIGNAIATMTAQNIGAGKRQRAMQALRWGIAFSLMIEVVLLAWCQLAPASITGALVKEAEVVSGAAAYLRSFSLDLILISFIFCINAYLSGCGKSSVSMIHSMLATFALRIPLSILFSRIRGVSLDTQLFDLGLAAPIASLLSIAICVSYVLWQSKQFRRLEAGFADVGE